MKLVGIWQQYWFRSSALLNLAIVRLVAVTFQLYYVTNNDSGYYYDRFLHLARLPDALYQPLLMLRVLVLPFSWGGEWYRPTFSVLLVVYWLTMAVGLCALIGFKTNVSLLGFAIGNLFLQAFQYSFGERHHTEGLMMMALLFLALSPAGAVLSVDDWQRRVRHNVQQQRLVPFRPSEENSPFAHWPLQLIQYMFALIYLSAALNKWLVGGTEWLNGDTLQFYLLYDGMRADRALGVWLGQFHLLAVLLSWVTLWFEWTFFLVLIFPVLAWIYVPMGIALHLGIELTMGATFFQFIVLYTAFIPWTALIKIYANRFAATGAKPVINFDGRCVRCVQAVTWLQYFDWFDRLTFRELEAVGPRHPPPDGSTLPTTLRHELSVLLPNGGLAQGFFALRALLSYLPLLWPCVPIFYAPFATVAGPKFAQLFEHRYRES